jgi:hypothetical protein
MHVIAHEHRGVNVHALRQAVLLQQAEHAPHVRLAGENHLAVVTPQNHMVWVISERESGKTGHPIRIIGI